MCTQSLNIAFIIANSADPYEMRQTTKLPFQGSLVLFVVVLHPVNFVNINHVKS